MDKFKYRDYNIRINARDNKTLPDHEILLLYHALPYQACDAYGLPKLFSHFHTAKLHNQWKIQGLTEWIKHHDYIIFIDKYCMNLIYTISYKWQKISFQLLFPKETRNVPIGHMLPLFPHLSQNFWKDRWTCLWDGTCWVLPLLFCSYLYQWGEFNTPKAKRLNTIYHSLFPTNAF